MSIPLHAQDLVVKKVLNPEFEISTLQKTAQSVGCKIDTPFTEVERPKYISRISEKLIQKIETFLKENTEVKSLLSTSSEFDARAIFEPIIKKRLEDICELDTSARNVPTYSLLRWVFSYFNSNDQ